jgi:FkbH-like protein
MRLSEALKINQQPVVESARKRKIHLVCGFTPLHLETFLKAHARLRFPGDDVSVVTGLFGDLEGNLQRASGQPAEGALVVLEWSELDERLGLRASAGWSASILDDVLEQVAEKLQRIETLLSTLGSAMPVAVVATTLPLPPLTYLPLAQTSAFELQLRFAIISFLNRICSLPGLRLVSDSALTRRSPHAQRHDVKLELHAGFPYTVAHAAGLARTSIECLFPPVPKKGLITDLDDTVWKGILGDVGIAGLSWCLEDRSQAHALYQQLVGSLAESGVLVAVASKNDPELVEQAFKRPDMLLKDTQVFPIHASWGAKSEAVGRILNTWNVGPDSVVFVDDGPMELAEVAENYPDIECLRFPADDPAAILELLYKLRERFGKSEVREEDRLRLQSLRASSTFEKAQSAESSADFLARLDAKLILEFSNCCHDGRALDLINKTNQFNLNGRRYTQNEWQSYFTKPGAFLVTAAYEDRFGPLGRIAVLAGQRSPEKIEVDTWVMSCRAFSRHIEFQILRRLYDKYHSSCIEFSYTPTERNAPLQEFFRRFFPLGLPDEKLDLSAELFTKNCPQLSHNVTETDK